MNAHAMFVVLISLLFPLSASADWAVLGVAVKCNTKESVFEVVSTVETSSPEYNFTAPDGFEELKKGRSQYFLCNLAGHKIELNINVYGPQPRGMGQGAGVIIIDSLIIDNHYLIDRPTNFNWQVIGERVLTEIHIKSQGRKLMAEMCYSDGWGWDAPYPQIQCVFSKGANTF